MATIDDLHISITQTPAVLSEFPSTEDKVNLASFKEKGAIHFCSKNSLIVAELKDFRISGNSKLTIILTANTTYIANFAGNVKSFSVGMSTKTA